MASETPVVKLLADGGLVCAKGLEMSQCGYKPGAKVCGKCGAKAVTATDEIVPTDAAPEVAEPVEGEKSEWVSASDEKGMQEATMMPKKNKPAMPVMDVEADGDCPKATQDIALNLKNRGSAIKTAMYGPLNPTQPNDEYWGKIADEWDVDVETAKKQRCGNCAVFIITPKMKKCISDGLVGDDRKDEWGAIDAAGELGYCEAFDFKCASKRTCRAWVSGGPILKEKTVEEEDVEKMYGATMMPKKKKPADMMDEDEDEEMSDEIDEDEEKMYGEIEKMMEQRKKARAKRMETMGVKSADYDDLAFVCAIERTVYAGGSNICASCPGGCEQQDTMPSLLEIEGMAESMFAGKVLDSGYADEVDVFVVDVQRKDGKPVEAYFDGATGECMGWHLLTEELIGEVASIPGQKVISFGEASDIATKSIQGEVVSVDADMFEGYDAYAVEIEGLDGKSYDVYVGVDGEILGFDEYDPEEAADIDEEVADIALKAMYSEDERMEMAKGGMAMPDGSYPIKDEEDLKMAIMAVGRAKDPEGAKMHCMRRAKELGLEDMIPETFVSEKPKEKVLLDDEAKEFLSSLMELEMLEIENGLDK